MKKEEELYRNSPQPKTKMLIKMLVKFDCGPRLPHLKIEIFFILGEESTYFN